MQTEALQTGQDGQSDGQELHLSLRYVRGFLVEHQMITIIQPGILQDHSKQRAKICYSAEQLYPALTWHDSRNLYLEIRPS